MTFKSDHACLQAKPLDLSKLIYCSRTVPELEKVNKQVKFFGNIFSNYHLFHLIHSILSNNELCQSLPGKRIFDDE